MADFGYLSDTDDSAVEELISQAKELSALEQVAAINCSAFTDSTLPDDLETRFRRLKSLPAHRPDPISSSSSKNRKKHLAHSKSVADYPKEDGNFSGNRRNPGKNCGSGEDSSVFSGNKRDLGLKSGIEKSSRAGLVSDGSGDFSDSGNIGSSSSSESKIFAPAKQTQKLRKEKRRIGSASSIDTATPPSSDSEPEKKSKSKPKSSSSWFDKLSPSKVIGFIFRSPSKSSNKKKNIKSSKSFSAAAAAHPSGRERDMDFDEFLSDLNAFSVEDQRKMLKRALKEQQKMRKEAAEIIKMTKKASAKLDFDD